MSASQLKAFLNHSPKAFQYYLDHPKPATIYMQQGELVDHLITRPDTFDDSYVVAPKVNKRTKAGKEEWAAFEALAESKGARVIDEEMLHNAERIVSVISNDPIASDYLVGSGQEPFYWHDEEFDVDCRYMPDLEDPEQSLLVDLKKTRSASPSGFARQAYQLGYDVQMAHYAEGYRKRHGEYPRTIALLAYEWDAPHDCSVHVVSEAFLDEGRRRREEAIVGIKECRGCNEWPSYGLHVIDPPNWVRPDDPANSVDLSGIDLEGLE